MLLFLGTRTGTLAGLFERAFPLGGVNQYIVGPLLRELPGSELGQHQRSPGPWLGCIMSTLRGLTSVKGGFEHLGQQRGLNLKHFDLVRLVILGLDVPLLHR